MRYQVFLREALNDTAAVNGDRIQRTRRGVYVIHRGVKVQRGVPVITKQFVPWTNVSYISDKRGA